MPEDKQFYAYTRKDDKGQYLVICNLSKEEASFASEIPLAGKELVLSNYQDEISNIDQFRPYEARLYRLV